MDQIELPSPSKFKTVVTLLSLVFFTPVGITLVLFWSGWSKKAKILAIIAPMVLIPIVALFLAIVLTSVRRIKTCEQYCLKDFTDRQSCVDICLKHFPK